MDFYNFTYIYANGYLKKFRNYFDNLDLTYQGLTAILKTFYEYKKWRLYKDNKGQLIWYKGDLDRILLNRNVYLPQIKKVCFDKWEKNRISKGWEKEPPIDYSSEEEDMNKISDKMIYNDNYGEIDEAYSYYEPQYTNLRNISYFVSKDEDGDLVYNITEFETFDDGTYSNAKMECDKEDLQYYFGNEVANDIIQGKGKNYGNYITLNYDNEESIDTANVEEVNDYAKKIYGTTTYFKHAGYLLVDGEMLNFGGGGSYLDPRAIDHHNLNINGVTLYDFLALGNIRITPEGPGFEFCKTPTREQIGTIKKFISEYGNKNGYFLVDRVDAKGNQIWNKEYESYEYGDIISDILSNENPAKQYHSQFEDFLEEKKMGKKIYITEKQLKHIISESIKYCVEPEKVRIVKTYLDDNFIKGGIPCLGEDGYPTTTPIVALKGTDGQAVKNMTDKQLFALLIDRFQNIYSNDSRKKRFLQQIMKDWYYDRIKNNLLSVNEY